MKRELYDNMLKEEKDDSVKWELLMAVLSGDLPESDPEFAAWLTKSDQNKELYLSLKNPESGLLQTSDKDRMYRAIADKLTLPSAQVKPRSIKLRKNLYTMMKYASIIVLLAISTTVVLWINHSNNDRDMYSQNIIKPGGKKARLTIGSGETFDLTTDFNIDNKDGNNIVNHASQELNYEQTKEGKKIEFHTLEVPKGGEYELKLSDGTRILLNSESKITYPSFFTGEERKVELVGEAYFEVTKSQAPFIVRTKEMDVRVLGTSFNVSAYGDDDRVNTTLVSGKVQVLSHSGAAVYDLAPGYNLTFDKSTKRVNTEKVDTEIYTAWTRGEFLFYNQDLDKILTQLSRWYDFEVEYKDDSIRKMRFTGGAEKKQSINYLLTKIEMITNLKFKEDGKRIVIHK